MLASVTATRFVAPLREGGSLPGIVEADDLGIYVVKFRAAGQGVKVLVAEIIVGELARRFGLSVPRLAVVELDAVIGKYEADEEVQDLLTASVGRNLGSDFLPGAFGWHPRSEVDREVAARIVVLDAYTANVDRTWRNPNLLVWHGRVWPIDHGAALYFHHSWTDAAPEAARFARQPFDASQHVLQDRCTSGDLAAAYDELVALVDAALLDDVLAQVPDEWLAISPSRPHPAAVRQVYVEHLLARIGTSDRWLPSAEWSA